MSLTRLLSDNRFERYSTYFTYANHHAAGYYYGFSVVADSVKQLLAGNPAKGKDSTTLSQKKSAISDRDPATWKNAFHAIFSAPLTVEKNNPRKDYYILSSVKKQVSPYLESDIMDYDAIIRINFTDQHTELLRKNLVLSLGDHPDLINEEGRANATQILEVLLNPYKNEGQENHNAHLTNALQTKDKQGNTPLHYAWQGIVDMDFSLLRTRIGTLSDDDKNKLLHQIRQDGKTVLHLIVTAPASRESMAIFGVDATSKTLACRDQNYNTPWHDALKAAPLETIQDLYLLFPFVTLDNAEVKEEKHAEPLDYLFGQNKDGQNPLHFLCQRDSKTEQNREENVRILQTSFDLPPHNLLEDCVNQPDKDGLTPLNYAIQSGNFPLAQEILRRLQPAEQKKALAHKHFANKHFANRNESMLHYICRYGNEALLRQAVEILGPEQLYRIDQECTLKYVPNRQISKNFFDQYINQNKDNKLFNCFEYFVNKYAGEKSLDAQGPDFTSRFQDFCNCLAAIQSGVSLPGEGGQFHKKIAMFGRESEYHKLRSHLSSVTPAEYQQFQTFIWGTAASDQKAALLAQHIVEGWSKAQVNESKSEPSAPHRVPREPSAPTMPVVERQQPFNPLSAPPQSSAMSMWEVVPPRDQAPQYDADALPPSYESDDDEVKPVTIHTPTIVKK